MNILQMNITASALILGIIVFRALMLYRLPKKTFFVLWLVVALRLVIPFSIPLRMSIDVDPGTAAEGAAQTSNMIIVGDGVIHPGYAPAEALTAASVLKIVWIAGMCIAAVYFIISYVRFMRQFKRAELCEDETVKKWFNEHPLRRNVRICRSDYITTPLTYGIFRPVLLLPQDTDRQDKYELRFIIAHEYIHIRRFDALTKLLLTAIVCVHWFNPLVWVMWLLANRDMELSCDEAVIKMTGYDTRSDYASMLLNLEETKTCMAFPLATYFGKHGIEERITGIMKTKKYTLPLIVIALVAVIGFGTAAAFALSLDDSEPKNGVISGVGELGGKVYSGIPVVDADPDDVIGEVTDGMSNAGSTGSGEMGSQIYPDFEIRDANSDDVTGTVTSDVAFEVESFGGNSSFSQQLEITEETPYWEMVVVNKGGSAILVDAGSTALAKAAITVNDPTGESTVYKVEAGCTAIIYSDTPWEPGTYFVSFSGDGGAEMQGWALCHKADKYENINIIISEAQMDPSVGDYAEIYTDDQQNFDDPTWEDD